MTKKIIFLTVIFIMLFAALKTINTTPQKVLLIGRLMGFEIDSENINGQKGAEIATSSKKIGTVTFIKKDTNEFAALGHSTTKNNNKKLVTGICYTIHFEGIKKGTTEGSGNIIASLDKSNQIGYINYDSACGIFGKIDKIEEKYQEVETACWYDVRKGKANILIAMNEEELQSYEVEVTGIDYINRNKNIKLKITDPKLIEKTGGIVQGMSGTPLMQDGKLIGAINYVSENDPSLAYAVFVDKLL